MYDQNFICPYCEKTVRVLFNPEDLNMKATDTAWFTWICPFCSKDFGVNRESAFKIS